MELFVVLFDLTVWYVLNMPVFLPVAIMVSAVFAMTSAKAPRTAARVIGLAALSAIVADIGFVIVWSFVIGKVAALIALPLFFLWIIGMAVAVPTILVVWVFAKAGPEQEAKRAE